jgi:heterodisulfide reductase subunit A
MLCTVLLFFMNDFQIFSPQTHTDPHGRGVMVGVRRAGLPAGGKKPKHGRSFWVAVFGAPGSWWLKLKCALNCPGHDEGETSQRRRDTVSNDIMVIGGGIAGIQASLDLAEMGIKVHLVERLPSIGGKMAQLDKTFPTNDCAI